MSVIDNPAWVGALALDDSTTYYCCSVRCTLGAARQAERVFGVGASRLRRVRVPDYLHAGVWIDAESAIFVVDSDVRGPMGLEAVPAAGDGDAATIMRRHGGRGLRYKDITVELLAELKGRAAGP